MHLGALPTVFAGLDPDDSQEAASFLQPLALDPGELIMEQGEEDYSLAFVMTGSVQLLDGDIRVGAAAARDMLGEVELFGQIPRVTTALASGQTHLLVLSYDRWLELCERGSPVVHNMERFSHRRISERIKWLNQGIVERTKGLPFALQQSTSGFFGRISNLLGGGTKVPSLDPVEVLNQSALFNWAPPEVIAEIAQSFVVERFEPGTLLCRQGEVGDKVYLIAEGTVDVVLFIGHDSAETIATLTAGQAFGDASLAQNAPRSASCANREALVALTMTREKYGELFAVDDVPGSVFRQSMLKNLIGQFLATQNRYVELEKRVGGKVEDTIRGTPVSSVWRD